MAIGTFDGVHLGHRQVLHGCDTVLTFDPHPLHVIAPGNVPRLLSDRRLKLHKLGALGIRRVAVVPFDRVWSRVTAEEFVERVVIDQLDAGSVSVGQGFRFGARGAGTTATFETYPSLRTRVVPLVTRGDAGETISSSRIRRLVSNGEVEEAATLLGTPLTLPAEFGHDGTLLIAPEYARPAPGLYVGEFDGDECSLRVGPDRQVEILGATYSGGQVQLSFLRRVAS